MRGRCFLMLVLIVFAGAATACQIEFTPDLKPLELATLPPQPFGSSNVEPGANATIDPALPPVSPQDQAFDESDPAMWIRAIESRWGNIDVVSCTDEFIAGCRAWPAEELALVYGAVDDYILEAYIDQPFKIVRVASDDYAGRAVTRSDNSGNPYYEIRISDRAWKAPPALGLLDAFDILRKDPEHFQGTVAHELTHLAVSNHPELLDWWIEQSKAQGLSLSRRDLRLGFAYDWARYKEYEDDTEFYARRVHEEQFAMAVSALMYEDSWR